MKTWQKITIGIMAIITIALGYLFIRGLTQSNQSANQPDGEGNPIFPFDTDTSGGFFGGDGEEDDDGEDEEDITQEDVLWQVTEKEIAGAGWVKRATSSDSTLWHVRKENGHVYRSSEESREPERIINTTIPRVREALIAPDGGFVIYRYLEEETIKTYLGNVTTSTGGDTSFELDGGFLPDNISSLSISPDGNQVFYLQPVGGETAGVVYTPQTEERTVIYRSSINEWRTSWPQPSEIMLTTAPARDVSGFSYSLNPNTGSRTKITDGDGLTATESTFGNEDYIFSGTYSEAGTYSGRIFSETDKELTILSPETLAEKCSWANGAAALFCGIPDQTINQPLKNWYQGRFFFTDQLYLFNPQQQTQAPLFSDEQLEKGPFDITNISIDTDFNLLSFTNKRDGSLWAFEL